MGGTMNVWEMVEQRFGCNHEHTRMTQHRKSNGVICVYEQCTHCGEKVAERKKADFYRPDMPWFDDEFRDAYRARANAYKESLRGQIAARIEHDRDEANREWWAKYNQYLRSQAWHTIRERVLQRDNYICQACLHRKATQVHHLSYKLYDQLGHSMAFELVAICHQCHERIHPHMAEAQKAVTGRLYNPFLNGVQHER